MAVFAALIWMSAPASAEEKIPKKETEVEMLQKIDTIKNLEESVDNMLLLVDSMTRKKESACRKAFGNQKFCKCIAAESPVGTDFYGYIQIVTTPKDELGYSKATKETKDLIDYNLKARAVCGKWVTGRGAEAHIELNPK